MVELYTELEIEASAADVWQVLTNFADYPIWNPFIHRIKGEAALDTSLEIYIHPLGEGERTLQRTITRLNPDRELHWQGHHWGLPGLFDGGHSFIIEPLAGNQIRFINKERFTGLLVPFLARWLNNRIRPNFELMNQALKARAERVLELA
jgi:hypothetical protein